MRTYGHVFAYYPMGEVETNQNLNWDSNVGNYPVNLLDGNKIKSSTHMAF